jgi:hypothetical protein
MHRARRLGFGTFAAYNRDVRLLAALFMLLLSCVVSAGAMGSTRTLDNCRLITKAELTRILKSPVQIRRGEGLTRCNFFWKGKRLIILSVGPAPWWGYQDNLRQAKRIATRDSRNHVRTLTIGGNPAYEAESLIPGLYSRSVYAFHHSNMLQLTTNSFRSAATLPSFSQLRAITAIVLQRF